MKFTKGNNLSTGRPIGSKNTRTTELKNLLRDLLFDKDQMIQDWNDMDLMQRSEFRIRMAKYVTPEVKDSEMTTGFNKENVLFDVSDMETAILKDQENVRKIQ